MDSRKKIIITALLALQIVAFGHNSEIKGKKIMEFTFKKTQNLHIKNIVLLGASIGKAWDISFLPKRISNSDYTFEYVGYGGFDKTLKLKEIISRPQNKPDAIIIKECAAYFPGELEKYKELMEKWIKECHAAKVVPIPATVIPVTRLHSFKLFLNEILKRRNPFRFGNPFKNNRNNAILENNDWIRLYCENKGLAVLDLEAAVRYSEKNRYLREDLAKIDGLHLNTKAYKMLDQIVIQTLKKINW